MGELIPFIFEKEYKSIAKELLGKDVSIRFDGTTRDGEALAMLICYVHEWKVKVHLVRFQLIKSSVNGDELARKIIMIEVLHRKLDVLQNNLVAAMRDRAPVNSKALRTVSILCPNMMDIRCTTHFLDRVGSKCHRSGYIIYVVVKCRVCHQRDSKMGFQKHHSTRNAKIQRYSMVEPLGMSQSGV